MVLLVSGQHFQRSTPRPSTNAAGSTRRPTSSNYVPKSLRPKVKEDIHEIWKSPTRDHAKRAIATFETKYGAKYPKAVHCLTKDTDALLAFYDFPAEHWVHLRTSNPIESTFSIVRHRTIKVKGAFSNESALGMLYQLGLEAEKSWRRITGHERIAEVISGVAFVNGVRADTA